MSDDGDVIRIGRGVPTGTPPTPQPAGPGRRTTLLLISAGVLVGLGLAVFLVFGRSLFGPDQAGPLPQVPMATPTGPNLKVLDERASCVLLVPAVTEAGNLTNAVIAAPNAADMGQVQKSYDNLMLIADMSAPELRDDVKQIAAMLSQLLSLSRTGGTMTFDMGDFKSAGLRIGARCAKYVTS